MSDDLIDEFDEDEDMDAPCKCVCGEIVEQSDMMSIRGTLPDGNLVCEDCWCDYCQGQGECESCGGSGTCDHCGGPCPSCDDGECKKCHGKGYLVGKG